MILHKCHEYYDFCDGLAQFRGEITQIKEDEIPGENGLGMASMLAGI